MSTNILREGAGGELTPAKWPCTANAVKGRSVRRLAPIFWQARDAGSKRPHKKVFASSLFARKCARFQCSWSGLSPSFMNAEKSFDTVAGGVSAVVHSAGEAMALLDVQLKTEAADL